MKPHIHSRSSVKKWGGKVEDYQPIHDFIDSPKSAHASVRHRAILHNSFGCYLVEKVFGVTFINSEGKEVSTRDVAENHIQEDLGRVPSLDEWLKEMNIKEWMGRPFKSKTTFNLTD
jgi:hypothetical protein